MCVRVSCKQFFLQCVAAVSSSTSPSCYDEKEHNMWNSPLELFFHMRIGQYMKPLVDEVSTARIALSCHFALDTLCDKEGGAVLSDSLSNDSMCRDLKELWPNGHSAQGRKETLNRTLRIKTIMKVTVTTTVIASNK